MEIPVQGRMQDGADRAQDHQIRTQLMPLLQKNDPLSPVAPDTEQNSKSCPKLNYERAVYRSS
jgi:hypothetical protein